MGDTGLTGSPPGATVVAGPDRLASILRRGLLDAPYTSKSVILDVGMSASIPGYIRRAVQLRDRECFHPLCDLPAEDCQVDHVVPYAAGGETTQENGRPACVFHNRERHRRP